VRYIPSKIVNSVKMPNYGVLAVLTYKFFFDYPGKAGSDGDEAKKLAAAQQILSLGRQ